MTSQLLNSAFCSFIHAISTEFFILVIFLTSDHLEFGPVAVCFFGSFLASEVLTSLQDLRDQFILPLIIPSLNPIREMPYGERFVTSFLHK